MRIQKLYQQKVRGHMMNGGKKNVATIETPEIMALGCVNADLEILLEKSARVEKRVFFGSPHDLTLVPRDAFITDIPWLAMLYSILPSDVHVEYPVRVGNHGQEGATVRGLNGRSMLQQGHIYVMALTEEVIPQTRRGEFTCETQTKYIARLDMPAPYLKRPIIDQDSGRILDLQKL